VEGQAALYLASDKSRHTTGLNMRVDAGLTCHNRPGAISSAGAKGGLNKLRESEGTMKDFKGKIPTFKFDVKGQSGELPQSWFF
jgi:hypothetical protein